ncbi:MAG: hypothetical protein WCX28_07450 [Bacteriovoracaceae bacterium]|nr:hypothetical protein [Bacteroidota bacterium]
MKKFLFLFGVLMLFSSCQKKRTAEPGFQQVENYVPPASEAALDTMQAYISPSDPLNDRSSFTASNFQAAQIKFRGTRNIMYQISMAESTAPVIVVEYLNGEWSNGDTVSTTTRILLYVGSELLYRKAFPIEFSDAVNFSRVRKFNHTILSVNQQKSIVYYWFDVVRADGSFIKEYHAVCVDNEGVTNELSGDITRIGGSFASVRFLNENRLKAKVPPGSRYSDLAVDLLFSIDWNTCAAVMDVPVDTIFIISDQPSRYFSNKIKLFAEPQQTSTFRETNFRRLTQAKLQRAFVPSLFDSGNTTRDRIYVEFNKTTKGWIDHDMMLFEEIISEN